ncbi:MAG: glycosyltransferase family 2 protein [Pseudomonadota bacterium]
MVQTARMTATTGDVPLISVIALTRDRQQDFRSLMIALSLQRYPNFEVIVVGANPTVDSHGAPPALARRITYAQCVEQNISRSRNIGLSLAAGEIVAFIDDDAAPEADWLERLIPLFQDPEIGGVGGFVRGRNGVDYQWQGAMVDRYGGHIAISPDELRGSKDLLKSGEYFLSTVGVNSAYRRSALHAIKGFDENFHYFLDESDICVRLQQEGWTIGFAAAAEVHHAYSASSERRANRAPRDLFQIAASRAYFGRCHGHVDWQQIKLDEFRDDQTRRLAKFVQLGRISRRQADAIVARMEEGLSEGLLRYEAGKVQTRLTPPDEYLASEELFGRSRTRRVRVALVVGSLARSAIYRAARQLAQAGFEVSVIDFSLRAQRLKVWFSEGIWHHVGGILGRDRFGEPLPVPRRCLRVKRELQRIGERRQFDCVIRPAARKFKIGDMRPANMAGILSGYVAEPLHLGGAEAVLTTLS